MGLLGLLGLICAGHEIIKDATLKPLPPNSRFDDEAYFKDIREGVPRSVIDRKMKRFEYYTTKPKPPKPPKDAIIDVEHYNYDVEHHGKEFAESMRRMGIYRYRRHRDFW